MTTTIPTTINITNLSLQGEHESDIIPHAIETNHGLNIYFHKESTSSNKCYIPKSQSNALQVINNNNKVSS